MLEELAHVLFCAAHIRRSQVSAHIKLIKFGSRRMASPSRLNRDEWADEDSSRALQIVAKVWWRRLKLLGMREMGVGTQLDFMLRVDDVA